jgi:hypothetical protein
MLLPLVLALAAAPAAQAADDAAMLDRMVLLYDNICLQKFPDDAAAGAAAAAAGGEPLAARELNNSLYGRHGQGWRIADGDGAFIVTIENPPYHGCSIRRTVSHPVSNIGAYRALADRYEATKPGFKPIPTQTFTQDGVASKGFGEVLVNGQSSESLMFFNKSPAKGSGATEFRLVHLYHSGTPDAGTAK